MHDISDPLIFCQSHHESVSVAFLGITGRDPGVSKINQFHVDIFRCFFIKLGYTLWIPLKWSVILLQSWWTSTGYFSNSTCASVTNCQFSSIIDWICSQIEIEFGLPSSLRPGSAWYFWSFSANVITNQCPCRFLGIIGRDPGVSKINSGYMLTSFSVSLLNRRVFCQFLGINT